VTGNAPHNASIAIKEAVVTETHQSQTRRDIIAAALIAAGAVMPAPTQAAAPAGGPSMTDQTALTGHEHDWDWLVGRWNVRHRRLKARLAGSTEWEEFDGTSALWLTLGGLGTIDDNVIALPGGTYRAVTVRAFDPKAGQWSIWWLDGRYPTTIEPPVHGGFRDGVGTFIGDDTLRDRPIKVRLRWSDITATSAHWEQAFSPDGGGTWETNWAMDFIRA
jgi:hypothetical protein